MRCPILEIGWMQTKVGDKGVSSDCLRQDCAWWEEHFGKCCIAIEAHLKGMADHRLEVKESQRDRF